MFLHSIIYFFTNCEPGIIRSSCYRKPQKMCKICIIAAVWLLEKKKYIGIFLQREEKGANLLVFSEKWLSRIQGFFNVSQFYWKIIAEFDARILHTRLICRSKIFFAAERSPLEYFEQELLFVWNWYCCPKVIFFLQK